MAHLFEDNDTPQTEPAKKYHLVMTREHSGMNYDSDDLSDVLRAMHRYVSNFSSDIVSISIQRTF